MSEATKPDAFKALMEQAKTTGRPELAHQSLGRPLTEVESRLADALMNAYAEGAVGEQSIAEALLAKGVVRPSTGSVDWTAANLAAELQALNADLDAAYQENGLGA